MNDRNMTIRLPARLKEALEGEAASRHVTKSKITVEALEFYLKERTSQAQRAKAAEETRIINESDPHNEDVQAWLSYAAGEDDDDEDNPWW